MAERVTQIWASGGGTQSAAIAALIVKGKIPKPDLICISDTGREQSTTWKYQEEVIVPALASVGLEINSVSAKKYATVDLYGGKDKKTLLIPAFTNKSGDIGKLPTFCSNEWKTRVIHRWASELGVKKAEIWLGISTDEKERISLKNGKWSSRFPLIEQKMNRWECIKLVESMGWPMPPRSSCWMCPNHLQEEWRDIRDNKPDDWQKAIVFDREIRKKDPHAFLHPDCVPLEEANLDDENGVLFGHACQSGQCFI